MAKLSKQDWKLHERANDLVESDSTLTWEERDFIFDNWNPMARNDVGAAGAFFTPAGVAHEFHVRGDTDMPVIDLCAGIGILTYQYVRAWQYYKPKNQSLICIERNYDFYQVGKRLVPEAHWIHDSIFNQDLIADLADEFDDCLPISNPPFGAVTVDPQETKWLIKSKDSIEVMAMDVALHLSNSALFILPEGYVNHIDSTNPKFRKAKKIKERYPNLYLELWCTDLSSYDNDWKGANPKVQIVDLYLDGQSRLKIKRKEKPIEQFSMFENTTTL